MAMVVMQASVVEVAMVVVVVDSVVDSVLAVVETAAEEAQVVDKVVASQAAETGVVAAVWELVVEVGVVVAALAGTRAESEGRDWVMEMTGVWPDLEDEVMVVVVAKAQVTAVMVAAHWPPSCSWQRRRA